MATPLTQSDLSYIVVQPQIIGSPDDWGMQYLRDGHRAKTARGAFSHGLRLLGHDDFWVCEMRGDTLRRILHSDLEPRPLEEEEFAWVRESLAMTQPRTSDSRP